jgi:sodium/bile acid cotransporter 7
MFVLGVVAGCTFQTSPSLSDRAKVERIDLMYERYQKSFPDTPAVRVDQLIAMRQQKRAVLVDSREPREQQVSMIPDAISLVDFTRDASSYVGRPVVFYCTIGYRSGVVAAEYCKNDVDAYNLKGGILSWVHAGQNVVDGRKETRKVHVYGSEWNLLPCGYEAVW